MKIIHIINCLDTGGAELMLLRLLSKVDRTSFEPEVISLTNLGEIACRLNEHHIPVRAMGLRRDTIIYNPTAILRLASWLRQSQPDLVQTWMYHSNLIGGVSAKLAGHLPLVWSIRQTKVDLASVRLRTSLVAKGTALLSRKLPDHILYNSHVSRQTHTDLGYAGHHASVIPNGFDLEVFKPNPAVRSSVRRELGLADGVKLVGLIARYDPQKDHGTFIAAAARLRRLFPSVQFILAGFGVNQANTELVSAIKKAGLDDACQLLGHRCDVPRLMAALDIACSSSTGEGFPNTVGEAMASGVPCVVTDAGDSALLVGHTGTVVPPARPEAFARAIAALLKLEFTTLQSMGVAARERIAMNFSLDTVAKEYQTFWQYIHDKRNNGLCIS